MAKVLPIDCERPFNSDELFFSTTDLRGIIQSGNAVFFRIAGYTEVETLGKPHNLIRHPDMPKAVFKLLWDSIGAGKMIAAYVKNMASDGTYYWVMAVVFPVENRYLSIRLKPSSPLFQAVKTIYSEMLVVEKAQGVEASAKCLFQSLEKSGFKTYEQFMTAALKAEIQGRDEVCSQMEKVGGSEVGEIMANGLMTYRQIFKDASSFDLVNTEFRKNSEKLFEEMSEFRLLSLNMRVLASQVGQEGASLAVVTESFQQLVGTIEERLKIFSNSVAEICAGMDQATLEVSAIKLQMDVIDFFIREALAGSREGVGAQNGSGPTEFVAIQQNADAFLSLSHRYNRIVQERLNALNQSLRSFTSDFLEMRKFVKGIELVSQIGAVEAARMKKSEHNFEHYINRMHDFAALLRASIQDLGKQTGGLGAGLSSISRNVEEAKTCIPEIFRIVLSGKTQGSAGMKMMR